MVNNYLPVFRPADTVTFTAGEALAAGQPVAVTGDWVVSTGEVGVNAIGFAGHDAEEGDHVTIEVGRAIHEAIATGAVEAGGFVAVTTKGLTSGESGYVAVAGGSTGDAVPFVSIY